MDIKGKLMAAGLWSDLAESVVLKIAEGGDLADWEVEASVARLSSQGPDAQAKLVLILSGGKDRGFARRSRADAKLRASLIDGIKARIKGSDLSGDERKPYYGALRYLANHNDPTSLLQAVDTTMVADFEEGLDLLMELRDRYRERKHSWRYPDPESSALMGMILLKVSKVAPGVAISAKHAFEGLVSNIFYRQGETDRRVGEWLPGAAHFLYEFSPGLASDILEGLGASATSRKAIDRDLRLIESLARLDGLRPSTRAAAASAMEPFLRAGFDAVGPKGAMKRRIFNTFLDNVDLFPHVTENCRKLARILETCAVEYVTSARKSRMVVEREAVLSALRTLVEGGMGRFADRLLGTWSSIKGSVERRALLRFWNEWTTFFRPDSVVNLLDEEALLATILDRSHLDAVHSRDLMTIFMAPRTKDLFEAFLSEAWRTDGLRFTIDGIVGIFSGLADDELLRGVDPVREEYGPDDLNETVDLESRENYAFFLGELVKEIQRPVGYEPGNEIKEREARKLIAEVRGGSELIAGQKGAVLRKDLGRRRLIHKIAEYVNLLGSMARTGADEALMLAMAADLLEMLGGIGVRNDLSLPFTRVDVAATAVAQAGEIALGEDILGILRRDIEEQRAGLRYERGIVYAQLIGRLVRIGHPQTARAAELVLDDLLTPPRRLRSDNPEEEVVRQVSEFFLFIERELASIEHTGRGEMLFRKASSIVAAAKEGEVSLSAIEEAEKVDAVFYGAPDVEDPLAPKKLAEGSEEPKTLGEGDGEGNAPDAEESVSMVVAGGAEYLAKAGIGTDARTGLAKIDIGGNPLSLWHARSALSAEVGEANRDDWHEKTSGSQVDAVSELERLTVESARTDRSIIPRATDTALARSNLDKLKGVDSVAMTMEAAGVDRQKLIDALKGAVSLRRGLAMLELALRRETGDGPVALGSVADAAQHLPNITSLEIAMLSLLDRVPKLLLETEGLTMIYGVTPGGIEWANDTFDPNKEKQGLKPVDAYVYMGITEMHGGTSMSFFTRRVKDLLVGILRSTLDDRFFFDHLWTWNVEAAKAGLRMMKRDSDPRRLINKEVIDLGRNMSLDVARIAKLMGLLERIPACLDRDEPARLYFKPFAAGIIFADHEGRPVEVVQYHPHLRSEAFREIFYKVEHDATEQNPLMRKVFDGEIFSAFLSAAAEQTKGESSPLEERAFEVQARFGVSMSLGLRMVREDLEPLLGAPSQAKSIKMDRHELDAIEEVLGMLPDHVWRFARDGRGAGSGIRIIRKGVSDAPDMVNVSKNPGILGRYDELDKGITMYHLQEEPYRDLTDVGQHLWKSALAHEVGEAIFAALPYDRAREFLSIYPWRTFDSFKGARLKIDDEAAELIKDKKLHVLPDMTDEEIAQNFLTSYSTHQPNDLFSEAFKAFVFHGPEFRQRAESSPYLRKLYDWLLDNVFTDIRGTKYEYSKVSDVTLSAVETQIRLWRHDMQNRAREHEEELRRLSEERGGEISSVAQSFESLLEDHFERDEEQYIREVSNGSYASGYFGVMAADEATRASRGVDLMYGGEAKGGAGGVHEAVKAIFNEDLVEDDFQIEHEDMDWSVDVFIDEDADIMTTTHGYSGMRGQTASEYLAARAIAWMAKPDMTKLDLVDHIQHDVDELEHRTMERFAGVVDEDLVDAIVDEVAIATAEGDSRLEGISKALSQHIMPGVYTLSTLKALNEIRSDRNISIIEAISRTYRLLMGSREFYMEVATAAELAQELYARTLLHYDDLMSMPIAKLIVELDEGAGSIYTIASALRVSPGQVDAFAETFLGKEDYAALEERSRYDGTVGQLVAAGVFYRTALKDIEQHGGKADPAMASALKRIGDMLSRLKGEKPSIEELTALLREVSPSATAAKDEDEGILEVGSSKRPDDDDDDGDPEGGGGGSAPFGGAFRAEDPGGTGGTSAAEHTATSAGTYTGWGSQFTEEQVSQAVMDGIIVSGAVVTATVMPLGAL